MTSTILMPRPKGLRPSRPERTAHRLGAAMHPAIAAALRAGPLGQSLLAPFRGPRKNQRVTSTCHAHSRSSVLYTAMGAAGMPLPFVPSPLMIASCTYADVRNATTPIGADLPKLQDVGAELQDSSDATHRWGLCPISPEPTDSANYTDVPDGTAQADAHGALPPFPEPQVDELHVGASRLTLPEYKLAGTGSSLVALVCASLDAKIPLQSGGPVGPAYEALKAGQIAMAEPNGDGHAQSLDGYRLMTDAERAQCGSQGKYVFEIDGSWGLDWANQGVALVSEEWVESQWDFFPAVVK